MKRYNQLVMQESTMPAVGSETNCDNDKVSDVICGTGDKCVINEERMCSTHSCGTRTITVSADKSGLRTTRQDYTVQRKSKCQNLSVSTGMED